MHRRLTRHFLTVVIGIIFALTPAYSATINWYNDSAVFNPLAQGMTMLTFNSLVAAGQAVNDYTGSGFTVGGVQFASLPSAPWQTVVDWYPGTAYDWSGGQYAVLLSPGNLTLHIVLPSSGYTAIAMNLATYGPAGGTLTVTANSGTTTIPTSSTPPMTFLGVTSDTPITSLDITSSGPAILLQNFQFGTAQIAGGGPDPEVPSAATMILIGTGLLALPLLRKTAATHSA